MAKKKQTAEEIMMESFGGSWAHNPFFKTLSKDEYIGYVAAMCNCQNLSSGIGSDEWIKTARELVAKNLL